MTDIRKTRHYGWRPDLPDARDKMYMLDHVGALPSAVDLRPRCSPVLDQGELGSCTSHAIAEAIQFDRMKQALDNFTPSRLMIYYNERVIEGTVDNDAGAEIRDGIKSVATQGACPEDIWPYDITKFTQKPPQDAYDAGMDDRAISYRRISHSMARMKGCLASGYPFVFGFTVYDSFESDEVAQTGIVPMPNKDEGVLGGHAVLAVGYNDATGRFIVQNSWGLSWGQSGFFEMPYAYLTDPNLSDDFWTIRLISQ